MLKRMFAMLVVCTAVISMQANAGTTTTVYCAVDDGGGLEYDYDYSLYSCGDYCKTYFFGDLWASSVETVKGQIKSDTEYYSFEWRYSDDDGAFWTYGGGSDDCSWVSGDYVCTAIATAYTDWTWDESATVLRFRYRYTSGGTLWTRYFEINQLIK